MQQSSLGYLTDIHLMNRTPRSRNITNFLEYQLLQLKKAFTFYSEQGINTILMGGDLFDEYTSFNSEDMAKIAKVFNSFDFNYYSCCGNHDLKGNSLESLEVQKTSLYLLTKLVPKFYCTIDKQIELNQLKIRLSSWKCDTYNKVMNGIFDESNDILVLHAPITVEPTDFTKGVKELKVTNNRLILLGDQHNGVPVTKSKGCTWYSPGAFTKQSAPEKQTKVPTPIIRIGDSINIEMHFLKEEEETWMTKETPASVSTHNVVGSIKKLKGVESEDHNLPEVIKTVANKISTREDALEEVLQRINNE